MTEILLAAKTLIGSGDGSVLVEPRQNAVRIKTRAGELYVKNESLEAVARALLQAAADARRIRA